MIQGMRGKDASHDIVVYRRPGAALLDATILAGRPRPQLLLADPSGSVVQHRLPRFMELVDEGVGRKSLYFHRNGPRTASRVVSYLPRAREEHSAEVHLRQIRRGTASRFLLEQPDAFALHVVPRSRGQWNRM